MIAHKNEYIRKMNFEESLAKLGAQEAEKNRIELSTLHEKLYTPILFKDKTQIKDDSRQYWSRGYDAHSEIVGNDDIFEWQKMFPYIGIMGHSMLHGVPFVGAGNDSSAMVQIAPTESDSNHSFCHQSCELIIIGKKIIPMSGPLFGEEIIAQEGIVEEDFGTEVSPDFQLCDINSDEYYQNHGLPSPSIDPVNSKRIEIVDTLCDVIYPHLIESSLMPLISRVVHVGREQCVVYEDPLPSGGSDVERYENSNNEEEEGGIPIGEKDGGGWWSNSEDDLEDGRGGRREGAMADFENMFTRGDDDRHWRDYMNVVEIEQDGEKLQG